MPGSNVAAQQPTTRWHRRQSNSLGRTNHASRGGTSTGGFIQADPATNTLIITAAEPLYRQLRGVIDQLDSRRAQVYRRVDDREGQCRQGRGDSASSGRACSASKGDNTCWWAQAPTLAAGGNNIMTKASVSGAAGANGQVTVRQLASPRIDGSQDWPEPRLGPQLGGIYTLGALARFLETNTGANILSTPNLMTLDNEEAQDRHRPERAFHHRQFTNTGAAAAPANPFQTIERKDVGLTLRVKPQIGEGGTDQDDDLPGEFQRHAGHAAGNARPAPPTSAHRDHRAGGRRPDHRAGRPARRTSTPTATEKVPGLGDIPSVGQPVQVTNAQAASRPT